MDGVVGTDFRHAVEFSRSGCAPSRSSNLSRGNSLNVTRLVSRCQTRRLGAAPPASTTVDRGLTRVRGDGSRSRSAFPPAFGAWNTLGGRRRRSQIRFLPSPDRGPAAALTCVGGAVCRIGASVNRITRADPVDLGQCDLVRAPGGPAAAPDAGLPASGPCRAAARRTPPAMSPPPASTGGLMLATPADDPPRWPTSDPMLSRAPTSRSGRSRRRAPASVQSDTRACPACQPYNLALLGPVGRPPSSGSSRTVRTGSTGPPETLQPVACRARPTPRTGERRRPLSRSAAPGGACRRRGRAPPAGPAACRSPGPAAVRRPV